MPIDLTLIDRGAEPDDPAADSAYDAAGTLNAWAVAIESIVTDIEASLGGKAPTSHAHAISDVTGLQTALDAKIAASLFDAHTLLAATSDNTPAALTVAEQTMVGRITGGNIAALTATQIRTLLNIENGATADQSAAEILAALLTVDGAGSGLDADLLDGQSSGAFATSAQGTAADAAKTKTDFLTVTQPVDLDAIETRVNALDAAVVLKGLWDASAGTFPGSGTAQAGDSYIVSVGGTVGGVVFGANDRIIAITDNASTSTYASNWHKADYTDEVLSVAGLTGAISAAGLRTAINVEDGADVTDAANVDAAGAVMELDYNAHTILAATSDNTPAALTVAEQTLVGRITGGNIAALTATQIRTMLNVADGATAYAGVATDTIFDADGDLAVGTGANTAARLAMGTALQQIRVNAGATALEYFTPSASGDFKADGTVDMSGQFRTDVGTFDSAVANGASANAYDFDTQDTYSTAGANLLRLRNNGTAIIDFSFQGGIDHANSGASTAAHSQSLNLNWVATTTQTSSGQYSIVVGNNNTASGSKGIALGDTNVASATRAVAIGSGNTTSAQAVSIGTNSTASAVYGTAIGYYASTAISPVIAFASGRFGASGDAQVYLAVVRATTTDATQTDLAGGDGSSRLTIPADTAWAFSALVVGRSNEADGNDSAAYRLEGLLARDESNNTAIVGSVTKTVIAESAGAAAWDVTAEADDTNEALAIKVTGEAATNIRWVAKVDIAQVTFA